MSSILTNNSAMVALQTLKSINMNLGKVQSEISTGKTVESAKDNAAVWAISKVMESDVAGFEAISDSLALGQATVGVALNGAETITDLLQEVKAKIVNSQEENVDRSKIQTDIKALTDQISSIVGAAQFNGLNLLNDSGRTTEEQTSNILSSLDRDSSGNVTTGEISVDRANLGTNAVSLSAATVVAGGAQGGTAATNVNTQVATAIDIEATGTNVANTGGTAFSLTIAGTDSTGATTGSGIAYSDFDTAAEVIGENPNAILYVAKEGDTARDIGEGLKAAFDAYAIRNELDLSTLTLSVTDDGLSATLADGGVDAAAISFQVDVIAPASATAQHTAGGDLATLGAIDVTTSEKAELSLAAIEGLIQTSIDTAAQLGSAGRQIDTQADFVSKLSDLLTSGIGSLVDADMEAASAKLQALQTQQQLGVQALSIANQAPQTILSLFR
ncbi:flagellin [Roseobacter sp. MH60115]|uniref:flagellin n=1 Tax=Roseobacter sp. MH60115 TaxID=2785324 RepID=UPI0018A2E894|nr:flagellin [Roseobacter sp. MH60115]